MLIPELKIKTDKDKALDALLDSVNLNTYAIERTALGQTIELVDDGGELSPTNPNPVGVYETETEEDLLENIIKEFNERWFENWHATPEEQRFKLVNLVKRIQEHADFVHKYSSTDDEDIRQLEFANIVKDIIVSDRRKEVDFYKKFVSDENFQMAMMHSLRSLVDKNGMQNQSRN